MAPRAYAYRVFCDRRAVAVLARLEVNGLRRTGPERPYSVDYRLGRIRGQLPGTVTWSEFVQVQICNALHHSGLDFRTVHVRQIPWESPADRFWRHLRNLFMARTRQRGSRRSGEKPVMECFRWVAMLDVFLSRRLRERVLGAALDELREELAVQRQRFRGRAWRAWVSFAFTLRALFCFFDTTRCGLLAYASRAFPERVRRWWTG